jgi:hypothetical protein
MEAIDGTCTSCVVANQQWGCQRVFVCSRFRLFHGNEIKRFHDCANGYAYREATAQIRKYRQTDYRKKDLNMHVEMILISKRL